MYSDIFCRVYNEFGWNYYPEAFGQQLLLWLERHGLRPKNSLDLGCGTGVMIPFYLAAQAGKIVAVDVSEKMVERAREKFGSEPSVELRASDALLLDEGERFDAVVIYNAYPHFFEKQALVEKVYRLVKPGGRFVVAHGSGRDVINRHHDAVAAGVSCGLRAASEESALWADKFEIETLVDTPGFYAFSGARR